MVIKLYNTKAAKDVVYKELTLLAELSFTDFLYDSFKNDIIVKNLYVESITDKVLFNKLNYVRLKIDDTTYSCFTGNVEFLQGLVNLYLHIDILSTYWNDIKELVCIVECNEKKYNTFINNNSRVVSSKKQTDNVLFPNGFDDNYKYILNVAGKVGVENG